MNDAFLFTCEHGGNRIPGAYQSLFEEQQKLLDSHRGYDPGALVMARALVKAFKGGLVTSTVSRLLIDLNRSIGHPQLFSERTRVLPLVVRNAIVAQFYTPYRAHVERLVNQSVSNGQSVIHISSHSLPWRHRDAAALRNNGFRGVVRGISRRPLVHV